MSDQLNPVFIQAGGGSSGGGSGTVTSVAATGDGTVLASSVGGSPVTTSGTLALSLANATANTVLGNATASPAAPTYGQVVNAQIANATIDLTAKVVNALPPANGGVANVATNGQGYFVSDGRLNTYMGLSDAACSFTNGTINQVLAFQFTLPIAITVSRVSVTIVGVSSSNFASVGIYNAAGTTKLIDSGTFSTTTATTLTNTITPVTLTPGVYWYAHTSNVTAATGAGLTNPSGTPIAPLLGAHTPRVGTAANASSAGVLPSSLGAITTLAVNMVAAVFEP